MNSKLLLKKKISFRKEYIEFLSFLHPDFEYVEDLDAYDNPMPLGIIYTGQYNDDTVSRLNKITPNWIIVNAHHFDLDLSTSEGLLKNLLPIQYAQLRDSKSKDSKNNELFVYKEMNYEILLEKIKYCLISNAKLTYDNTAEQSVYSLFAAILGTPDVLNREFFNIVNKNNVSMITSSILTFLSKVQSNAIRSTRTVYYARLITQSNRRYGKRIKQAVCRFVKSKANKEVALYNLLTDLNRAK